MPAENTSPRAASRTEPIAGSFPARSSVSARSRHIWSVSALRFSGRFKVTRKTRSSTLISKFAFIGFDLQAEQSRAQRLALRIHPQRHRSAAAERLAHQEVECAHVGQFEPLDAAFHAVAEERLDPLRGDLARQNRVAAFVV